MESIKLKALLMTSLVFCGCSAEASQTKQTPAKEDIIISNSHMSDELMENFHSFEERITKSDAIVYGEVKDFEMAAPEGFGHIITIKTFHVIETLHGDIEPDSDIRVTESGGYMTIADYQASLNEETMQWMFPASSDSEVSKLSEAEKKKKYISEVWDGYYYPQIGERAVYCLKQRTNDETLWRVAGAWQGKYREIEDGVLLEPNQYNSLSDQALIDGVQRINYEDLKKMIEDVKA